MSRIMNFASQSQALIIQHAEDNILSKKWIKLMKAKYLQDLV